MQRMKTQKCRKLRRRSQFYLAPKTSNTTRWSSTFNMIKRFKETELILAEMKNEDCLKDVMLRPTQKHELDSLHRWLALLEKATLKLQQENLDMGQCRNLFDRIVVFFPETRRYLTPDAAIIHSPSFEIAVVKVLRQEEESLEEAERTALSKLLHPERFVNHCVDFDDIREPEDLSETDIHAICEGSVKKRRMNVSDYIDFSFIPPTSNIVERFFSRAGNVYDKERRSLTADHLEAVMFLMMNKCLWNGQMLDEIIKE